MEGKGQECLFVAVLSIALLSFLPFFCPFILVIRRKDENRPWVGSLMDLYKAVG